MSEVLKTKSQMIMRIAELSEQNTLLRDELIRKSEAEQATLSALEENAKLKEFLQWLLKQQYYILPEKIKDRISEVLQ